MRDRGSGKRICHFCEKTARNSSSMKKPLVCLHPEHPLAQQLIDKAQGFEGPSSSTATKWIKIEDDLQIKSDPYPNEEV